MCWYTRHVFNLHSLSVQLVYTQKALQHATGMDYTGSILALVEYIHVSYVYISEYAGVGHPLSFAFK